jgi:hypothetical protein
VLRFFHAADFNAAANKQGARLQTKSLLGNSVKQKLEKIMLGRKTLKRLTIGMVAMAAATAGLASTASAADVICSPYNSQLDICGVWDWYVDNDGNWAYIQVDTFFRFRETHPHIDP